MLKVQILNETQAIEERGPHQYNTGDIRDNCKYEVVVHKQSKKRWRAKHNKAHRHRIHTPPHLNNLVVVPRKRTLRLGRNAAPEGWQELPEPHERHGRQREDYKVYLRSKQAAERRREDRTCKSMRKEMEVSGKERGSKDLENTSGDRERVRKVKGRTEEGTEMTQSRVVGFYFRCVKDVEPPCTVSGAAAAESIVLAQRLL